MRFNSLQFVVFFPVVVLAYLALPRRFRWAWLLAASYFFYMCWEPGYVLLIWASTAVDYIAGRVMGGAADPRLRRRCLFASLTLNLGLLFAFKYYNFFRDSLTAALDLIGFEPLLPASPFLLPVGISFYTFQTLSYTIEVYRGQCQPERHLGRFALYVAFFPQLVAGPIERAPRLLPQLRRFDPPDYARLAEGARRMTWGMIKKVVVADRLAMFVDPIYSNPNAYGGLELTLATVFFAFQIYCDFSGYTDIAIGAARVFGVDLMENFRQPYLAPSFTEFWRRWHISLSTWFRDYVYVPLGGNRGTRARWTVNILAVFALSGLWHGANWTFLIWGLLHAAYLLAERALAQPSRRLMHRLGIDDSRGPFYALRVARTFALTCFSWIFFVAHDVRQAAYVATHWWRDWRIPASWQALSDLGGRMGILPEFFQRELALAALGIALVLAADTAQRRITLSAWLERRGPVLRFAVYSAGLWAIVLFGVFRQKEFIYFAF